VKKLDLHTLRWLITIVVAYASISMLRSALKAQPRRPAEPLPESGLT